MVSGCLTSDPGADKRIVQDDALLDWEDIVFICSDVLQCKCQTVKSDERESWGGRVKIQFDSSLTIMTLPLYSCLFSWTQLLRKSLSQLSQQRTLNSTLSLYFTNTGDIHWPALIMILTWQHSLVSDATIELSTMNLLIFSIMQLMLAMILIMSQWTTDLMKLLMIFTWLIVESFLMIVYIGCVESRDCHDSTGWWLTLYWEWLLQPADTRTLFSSLQHQLCS